MTLSSIQTSSWPPDLVLTSHPDLSSDGHLAPAAAGQLLRNQLYLWPTLHPTNQLELAELEHDNNDIDDDDHGDDVPVVDVVLAHVLLVHRSVIVAVDDSVDTSQLGLMVP